MSVHHFDTRVAKKVGLNAAVIAYSIQYWCAHKTANEKDIHDGKAWVYNSMKAWSELLPYLSEKQIRTALKKLEDAGIVEVRNLNEKQYDQTRWYAYNGLQTVITIANRPNGQMELPEKADGIAQKGKSNCPKGQTNTNNKPNNKPNEGDARKPVRIPDDWEPTPEHERKAKVELRFKDDQWQLAVSDFKDYWRSAKGKAARKISWDRTFQNNLNTLSARWQTMRNPARADQSPEQPEDISLEDWKSAARAYCELEVWPRKYGPAPHQPGCKAPPGLLRGIADRMQGHNWHSAITSNIQQAA